MINKLLEEIKKEINFEFNNVIFEKSNNFKIIKKDGITKVYYKNKHEISRASLLVKTNADLPEYVIEERSDFNEVSFFVDCSRNSVYNLETLKKLMRNIACLGYNSIMIYTEDTYEVDDEPVFGYLRGKYTKAQMKELDEYGQLLGIEVIPAIQTLAHLKRLKRGYTEYDDLFDCDDILLIGNERVYSLIENMFKTLRECFTTKRVHIGMDEAHNVGRGQYLDINGYRNPFDVLMEHLVKVASIAEKYDFSVIMWSDMFWKTAYRENITDENGDVIIRQNIINQIPKNVDICHWDYTYPEYKGYEDKFKMHNCFNKSIWYAGSSYKCNGFAPMNKYSENEFDLAFYCTKKYGMKNLINCSWSDNGSEAALFGILPAMAYFTHKVYGTQKSQLESEFYALTGYEYEEFCKLDYLNSFSGTQVSDYATPPKSELYNDVFFGQFDPYVNPASAKYYAEAKDAAFKLIKGQYAYVAQTLYSLADVLTLKCDLGIRLRKAYENADKLALRKICNEMKLIIKKLRKYLMDFKVQWMQESKPHGFEVQEYRIGGLIERLSSCRNKILLYVKGKITQIEELNEKILPNVYRTYNPETGRLNGHNEFDIVSTVNCI